LTGRGLALSLELEQGRALFEPGARVSGVAAWSAPAARAGMELRLIRVTRGPGGRDLTIAETIPFAEPLAAERRPFIFTLPTAPYSFQGSLISLAWTLELVALPGEERAVLELIIAPGRQAIDLRPEDAPGPEDARP
jgi:hypothetical protein